MLRKFTFDWLPQSWLSPEKHFQWFRLRSRPDFSQTQSCEVIAHDVIAHLHEVDDARKDEIMALGVEHLIRNGNYPEQASRHVYELGKQLVDNPPGVNGWDIPLCWMRYGYSRGKEIYGSGENALILWGQVRSGFDGLPVCRGFTVSIDTVESKVSFEPEIESMEYMYVMCDAVKTAELERAGKYMTRESI